MGKNEISKSRVNQCTWSSCCFSSHSTCCVAASDAHQRSRDGGQTAVRDVQFGKSIQVSLFIHAHAENKSRRQNAYRLQARRPFHGLQHSRLPTKIISPPPSPSFFPHPHPLPSPKIFSPSDAISGCSSFPSSHPPMKSFSQFSQFPQIWGKRNFN